MKDEVEKQFRNELFNPDVERKIEEVLLQSIRDHSIDPFSSEAASVGFNNFIKKYCIDDIGKAKIRVGTTVMNKYVVGQEIAFGGFGTVYACENFPEKVIKVEPVSRNPEQFYYEVKVQREIASTGFSCDIEEIEVNEYPRHIYG